MASALATATTFLTSTGFGSRYLAAVLVEYVAESPLRTLARLLCKLADLGRVCQYVATRRQGYYARL